MGPNSDDREVMKQLVLNGMDVARFNFSHGNHEEHKKRYLQLRQVAEETGIPVAALLDTKGPEIRTGILKDGKKITLKEGQEFTLTTEEVVGDETMVHINYDGLNGDVKAGDRILIDDGKVELEAEAGAAPSAGGCRITARVVRGGLIKSGKSLAIEGKAVPMPTLTESDRKNIRAAVSYGITGVMLPFVRNKEDLLVLREALKEAGAGEIQVFAKIENMQMQHDDLAAGRAARSTDDLEKIEQELEAKETVAAPEKHFGMVAVCAGKGLAGVFRELGADQIIEGGQTMNPSTQDILEKINATPAEVVFVFPNNKNIIMAAEQTVDLTEKKVVVVPSKTVPQGVSAMLVFDPDASEEDNLSAMTDAMAGVTTMQITYAARDSDIDGHNIHAGEYLALWGSSLFGSSADLKGLLRSMAEKVHEEGHEFVTVYAGADLPAGQAEEAAALFREVCPECEVTLIDGGQPVYYYLISAE